MPTISGNVGAVFNGGTIATGLTVAPTSFATPSLVVQGDRLADGDVIMTANASDGAHPVFLVDAAGDVFAVPSEAQFGVFEVRTQEHFSPLLQVSASKTFFLQDPSGAVLIQGDMGLAHLGFFGQTPAARPTGVAVTAAAIHAALVTLGLITA